MAAKAKNQASTGEGFLDWLASLRLTVYTMIGLGVATLLGTVIPQVDVTLPRQVLLDKLQEPAWRVMHLLGLTDVFRSVWFIFLVALLMLNLIACSIRAVQRNRRLLASTGEVLDDDVEKHASLVQRLTVKQTDIGAAEAHLRRTVGEVKRHEEDGVVHLFAQNPPLIRYGNIVVHLSLLFVLAGALVRLLMAVEGHIALPEGGSLNVFQTREGELLRLPFDVRCEKFAIEFYPNSRRPKDYRSDLTIWRDGRRVQEKTIQVNDPLKQGPYRFFQASYGEDRFPVLRIMGAGLETELPVVAQQIHSIPGRRDGLMVDQMRRGEAGTEVHLKVVVEGEASEAWLPENGAPQAFGPYQIAYRGFRQGFYTGLLVNADPGVHFLWTGFGLFFVGLFWTLFLSHRRVWVRFEPGAVTVAGSASRSRERLQAWVDDFAARLTKG
jgi:cytochrome c biogenesis protein